MRTMPLFLCAKFLVVVYSELMHLQIKRLVLYLTNVGEDYVIKQI